MQNLYIKSGGCAVPLTYLMSAQHGPVLFADQNLMNLKCSLKEDPKLPAGAKLRIDANGKRVWYIPGVPTLTQEQIHEKANSLGPDLASGKITWAQYEKELEKLGEQVTMMNWDRINPNKTPTLILNLI